MAIQTYQDYQALESSEKIGLVIVEASKRLMGWVNHSGSIYKISAFDYVAIQSIADSGIALAEVASIALTTAGKFYNDRSENIIYLRTSDSVNPNSKFIAMTFRMFFSNVSIRAANDLASGAEVNWLPILKGTSEFGVELDNSNQLGFALEGSGKVDFINDYEFWQPIFDKVYFENQRVFIYSWNRGLPISQAKIIYRGRIQSKSYSQSVVSFSLKDFMNELRAPITLQNMEDVAGAKLNPGMNKAKQRRLYGFVKGHIPTNIDQSLPLTGYPLTGTVAIVTNTLAVTGSGTAFLNELSIDDTISVDGGTTVHNVDSITSNTACTISEAFTAASVTGQAARVFPSHPKKYINRIHLIAGHQIKEPSTTVVTALSLTTILVADTTDFFVNDKVLIGSEVFKITQVSNNYLTFSTATGTLLTAPTVVLNLSVKNVYIGNKLLEYSRDYTYNATTSKITLDALAEFNVAPIGTLPSGTVSFTNTSRAITGTNTFFKKDLVVGNWLRGLGKTYWFEILSVESDTAATLRTASSYNFSGVTQIKRPVVYSDGNSTLALDAFGCTENGTSTGVFIKTAAQIVKNILENAGLSSSLNAASFSAAKIASEHKLFVVIPELVKSQSTPKIKDVISQINQSVFGSLYQNGDFELEYKILNPNKPSTAENIKEVDVLSFSIKTESKDIVKKINLFYLKKEFDAESGSGGVSVYSKTSDSGTYLAASEKEFDVKTVLVDPGSAIIFAGRWGLLLELASSVITFKSKMQASRFKINDVVKFSHEKLYDRVGSENKVKLASVSAARKTIGASTIEIDDLGNSFSRCAIITANNSDPFSVASDDDKAINGFLTDTYGMQNNDPETFGINLIW